MRRNSCLEARHEVCGPPRVKPIEFVPRWNPFLASPHPVLYDRDKNNLVQIDAVAPRLQRDSIPTGLRLRPYMTRRYYLVSWQHQTSRIWMLSSNRSSMRGCRDCCRCGSALDDLQQKASDEEKRASFPCYERAFWDYAASHRDGELRSCGTGPAKLLNNMQDMQDMQDYWVPGTARIRLI